jgi:chaperonin GroEL
MFIKEDTEFNTRDKELFGSTVLDRKEYLEATEEFLSSLFKVLVRSYGPYGSNTLITTPNGPEATKDGYTILSNLVYKEELAANLHSMIKNISRNLVRKVGDGSTSSIIYSISIFYAMKEVIYDTSTDLRQFNILFNALSRIMLDHIKTNYTYEVDETNKERVLAAIASVSNNNDSEIGNKVFELMNSIPLHSTIKVEKDPLDSDEQLRSIIKFGLTLNNLSTHAFFLKNNPSVTLNLPSILFSFSFTKQDLDILNAKLMNKMDKEQSLVIISDMVEAAVMEEIVKLSVTGKNIFLIKSPDLHNQNFAELFIDAACYTDSTIVTDFNEFTEEHLGTCSSLTLSSKMINFTEGKGTAHTTSKFISRVDDIKNMIDALGDSSPSKRGFLKSRLSALNGVAVTVLASGRSDEEKSNRLYLIEDSIYACKSAIEKGYTYGANFTPLLAIRNIVTDFDTIYQDNINTLGQFDKDYVSKIAFLLLSASIKTYTIILEERMTNDLYKTIMDKISSVDEELKLINAITLNEEDINETSVLQPVETDNEILKSSFSIFSLLFSINQFIG